MGILRTMSRIAGGLALVATLAAVAAPPASAGLIGISTVDTNNGTLWDINTSTAAVTNPRTVNATPNRPPDMIALANNGTLYGVSQGEVNDGPSSGKLYTILLSNGAPSLIANLTTFVHVEGDIAIDPTTNELYAVDGSGGPLFKVNKANGQCTTVGTVGTTLDLSAMTFDSAGNLYAVDSFTSTLLTINKSTGAIVNSVTLTPAVNGEIGGLAFDTGDVNLYFAGGTSGVLYRLNKTSGAVVTIGPLAVTGGIYALAFVPDATPVPHTSWGQVKATYR